MNGVVFMGSKHSGLRACERLAEVCGAQFTGMITLDDSADARSVLPQLKDCAARHRVPCEVLTKPSQQMEAVRRLRPALVVVVGWYWLLAADVLAAVPLGFVGCHASLLPKYRGSAPLVWALLRGEPETGVTLFHLDAGMDSGDIIAQEKFTLGPDTTIAGALASTEAAIERLVAENVPLLLAGTAPRFCQEEAAATYASPRSAEDGLLDWKQPAAQIHNAVRAQTHPYPGAFTFLPDGAPLFIWKTRVFPRPFYGIPGMVCHSEEDAVLVACGEGAVLVDRCGLANAEPVAGKEMLKRGWRLRARPE